MSCRNQPPKCYADCFGFLSFWVIILLAHLWAFPSRAQAPSDPSTLPLVGKSDFAYLGAFSLPEGTHGASSFAWGGNAAMPYRDPGSGAATVFVGGHPWQPGTVAQVLVPQTLVKSSDWNSLPQALVLQNFVDLIGSNWPTLGGVDYVNIYGLLPYNGRLIVAGDIWFDASCSQSASHGVANLNLSSSAFQGFRTLSGAVANPRSLGGYMTEIPPEWRSSFGGPALTGNSALSIISCISAGPSASVFDPDQLGAVDSVPAQTVVYYPYPNYLRSGNSTDNSFEFGSRAAGIAFPRNTRSVLFFGVQSMAAGYCYGMPTTDPAQHLQPIDGGTYCYTLCGGYKGGHGYPYVHYVWAYDANDLLQVRAGLRQPWEVEPYARWTLDEMNTGGCAGMRSAGYDPATGRLYITQQYEDQARIDVYQLTDDVDPAVPGDFSATAESETRIRLTWAASADNFGIAGYDIERCQGENCSNWTLLQTLSASDTSWLDTGLLPLSTYRYRIRVRDTADNISDYSTIASSTTPADISLPITPYDRDGDGINDDQETIAGTNPLDPGSYTSLLSSRVCSEWNGFLGMWNIMEHVNMSERRQQIESSLFSFFGTSVAARNFSIDPGTQFDLLVHDMAHFTPDSYGMVCSTVSGDLDGDLDGRMVYYKPLPGGDVGSDFEFAFAMPFMNGASGRQYVPFNTYQPSLNPVDQSNTVANWIQVTNLQTSTVSGTLMFHAMDGQVLESLRVTLKGGARRDFSGHDIAGPRKVGIVEWIPDNNSALFHLRNVRYYYSTDGARFDGAFQLEGSVGTGVIIAAPLDAENGSSIVEISNTLNEKVNVDVNIYNAIGTLIRSIPFSLKAKNSQHLIADSYLNGSLGTVTIKGSRPGSILAVVMQYARTTEDQGIRSIYGIQAREALGSRLRGSYNTFLDQGCYLRIVNPTAAAVRTSLGLRRYDGQELEPEEIDVPAKGLVNYNLCSRDLRNVYGVLTLMPESHNSIYATVIRVGNEEQYRFPTPVRE